MRAEYQYLYNNHMSIEYTVYTYIIYTHASRKLKYTTVSTAVLWLLSLYSPQPNDI